MTVWVDRSSDLVPSYGTTGKSGKQRNVLAPVANPGFWDSAKPWEGELTIVDVDLIPSRGHVLVVVAESELAEGRQAGSTHPHLEAIVHVEVWQRVRLIVRRVYLTPVGGWDDFVDSVRRRIPVQIRIARPCCTIACHVVSLVLSSIVRVQPDGRLDRVVEA